MTRLTDDAVRSRLATAIDHAGGVRAFAKLHHLPPSLVSDSRTGRRALGPSVLAALRLAKHVTTSHYYAPITRAELRRPVGRRSEVAGSPASP